MIDMEDQKISEEATRLAADPAFAQKFEDVPGEPPHRRVRHCVLFIHLVSVHFCPWLTWGCRAVCSVDMTSRGHRCCARWVLQTGPSRKQPTLIQPFPKCLKAGPDSRYHAGLVTAQACSVDKLQLSVLGLIWEGLARCAPSPFHPFI